MHIASDDRRQLEIAATDLEIAHEVRLVYDAVIASLLHTGGSKWAIAGRIDDIVIHRGEVDKECN